MDGTDQGHQRIGSYPADGPAVLFGDESESAGIKGEDSRVAHPCARRRECGNIGAHDFLDC